jgi:hypothetical protein
VSRWPERPRLAAGRAHIIYLDAVTLGCADAWLRDRHDRWPRTANPHLFISRVTAIDTVPVSYQHISRCFTPAGITASQLREDRILDDAGQTADPVRLMRLFGISDTTAMKNEIRLHRAPRTSGCPATVTRRATLAPGTCGPGD